MLIRNVDVQGALCDVRVDQGKIVEIGTGLEGNHAFDGQGGALIPGLHDHHIHLNASAAAMNSVKCGPPEVETEDELIAALHEATGEGPLRGIGYHHSVAGEIDREWLDKNGPNRPVRIQHRGGRMWILNSLAMEAYGLAGLTNGWLVDSDHLLPKPGSFPDLNPLKQYLFSLGVTGVTEVTPRNGLAELSHYKENAHPLKLTVMGSAELTGVDDPLIGPLKLHYHDHNLPALEDLAGEIEVAHAGGRAVAAHCVTRAELMLTLAAIEMAGPQYGDRIEHAAIADEAAIEWMLLLGLIVVTQPNFIAERAAAYLVDVDTRDHKYLWRLNGLREAGLRLAAGSDAPFGGADPWEAMHAACHRPAGFGGNEALTPEQALALYTKPAGDAGGTSRTIEIGAAADMCLIKRPWSVARNDLEGVSVLATWIGGVLVYDGVD